MTFGGGGGACRLFDRAKFSVYGVGGWVLAQLLGDMLVLLLLLLLLLLPNLSLSSSFIITCISNATEVLRCY